MTPEDYFEIDRHSEAKHEFMFGEISKVRGGSPQHALIASNMCIALGRRLSGARRVFDSSLRVCLDPKTAFYVYPDLTVVEGPFEFLENANETLTNPKLVVEVLSPTSMNVELGSKARMYTRVPTLTDLLMIDQDRAGVEHWVRKENARWVVDLLEGGDAVLRIESLACEIPLREIYSGTEWPKV
jgi:Uma2 family endonuclease